MKISFDSLEEQNIQNFKGGEGVFKPRMHVGNYNKIMRATLPAGSSIGLHTHDTNSEIIFIISGVGTMEYDDTMEILNPGDCHYSTGNYYARRRMTMLFSMLDYLGIERGRTRVEWVSAAEGAKFAATMNEFVKTITELGENRRLEDLRCKE